jgi:K319-like protein
MKFVNRQTFIMVIVGASVITSCKKIHSSERDAMSGKPPVAVAGSDKVITLPLNRVTLDGSWSKADGGIEHFQWVKISGPASFNLSGSTAATTAVKELIAGTYQFELTVTDRAGLSAKDTVRIMVYDDPNGDGNGLPVANAGADQTITLPLNYAYLDGSASTPNGWSTQSGISFAWTMISGPSSVDPVKASLQETFQMPGYVPTTAIAKHLVPGNYLFRLQITKATGISADTVAINVVNDPLNVNTITYDDLVWQQGDVYGMGESLTSLTTSIRPDIWHSLTSTVPIQVALKLQTSSSWLPVQLNSGSYSYDLWPVVLWILDNSNNSLLIGTRASIKIKIL